MITSAILTLINFALCGKAGVYNAITDSITELNYETVTASLFASESYIRACNDGACEILNIDGTPTGAKNIPSASSISRVFPGTNLFLIELNSKKTYIYNSTKIEYPLQNWSKKNLIDGNKICTDTQIIVKLDPKPKSANEKGKNRKARNIFGIEPFKIGFKSKCYDLDTKKEELIPYTFNFSFNGAGVNNGGWEENDHGVIYKDGKVLAENVRNCEIKDDLDGNPFLRCQPLSRSHSISGAINYDKNINRLDNTNGAYVGRYKDLTFYAKQDDFGGDSIVAYYKDQRFISHSSARVIPSFDGSAFCFEADRFKNATCYDVLTKKRFTTRTDRASFIDFYGENRSDTIGFFFNREPMQFSKKVEKAYSKLYGDLFYYNGGFIVTSSKPSQEKNPNAISFVRLGANDSLEIRPIINWKEKQVLKVGDYFIYGAERE